MKNFNHIEKIIHNTWIDWDTNQHYAFGEDIHGTFYLCCPNEHNRKRK